MTYPIKTLIEICSVKTGKHDANHGALGGEYPFFTCADKPIKSPTYSFDGDSIILPGNGANVGLVLYYSGKFEAYQRTYILNDFKCNPRYVYHHLRCFWSAANRFIQFGSATNYIRMGNFESYKIPIPPPNEQKRIAEILDRAQSLISKRREAIAQLDTLTQAIFIEMFGDPVTNPFTFPFLPLENVISRSFQNGAYFPKEAYCNEGGVEMIHMSDAFEGIVKRGNLKRVICSQQDIERYKLSNTDLIVARRSLNYEGSVKPCLIPSSNEPLIFESSLIRVTPNPEKVKILYLFYYILNPYVRERFIFPFVTKSTISGINQGNLAKVLIMIPPIDLQNEFARRVEALERLKTAHYASLSELDALFASLQHRAFRGEL